MTVVNLIPVSRRLVRQRQQRIRWWVMLCALWCLMLSAVVTLAGWWWHEDPEPLVLQRQKIRQQIEDFLRTTQQLNQRTSRLVQRLEAAQQASQQIDWSVLLALIAHELGPEAALRQLRISQVPAEAASPAPVMGRPASVSQTASSSAGRSGTAARSSPLYRLEIGGLAQSQTVASQFVLRLQQTGLFEQVQLLRTAREPFGEGYAVAFQVLCHMKGEASP